MKNRGKIPGLLLILACLSACATIALQEEEKLAPELTPATTPAPPSVPQSPSARPPEARKADAILFLPPAEQPLPAEVTETLREILGGLRGKKNILFTLEAWPSAHGSREVNIALARQAVTRLRNELVKMGIRSYRIKTTVRGEQKRESTDTPGSTAEKQRVDVFLSHLTN